jgi:signal transduction histidine kinase
LKPTDPDGQVDLQEVLHLAYDGGGYRKYIYEGSPEPPLTAEDAEWAAKFLPRPV